MLKDTLQASERLKAGGFDEAHTRALLDLWAMAAGEEVTKQDLELVEARLTGAIKELRTEMKEQRADLEKAIQEVRIEVRDARLETTRSIRNWVAGIGGLIALLMTLFEFIA